jgi:excisionase family DNA binding protein
MATEARVDDPLRLLSREEAAKTLGIGIEMFDLYLAEGLIAFVPLGNTRRVPRHSLDAFLANVAAGKGAWSRTKLENLNARMASLTALKRRPQLREVS